MKSLLILIGLFWGGLVWAQEKLGDTLVVDNGGKDSLKIFRPTISDYKYRTRYGEYKTFDTTFTMQCSYGLTQYNHQDNFGRIQFANIGSGFQDLTFRWNPEQSLSLLPSRKSYFILGAEDVKYYDVKTPTTGFVYHSAMRNGASLQSTYTQNVGRNFNFSLEYLGLRSQGFYTNSLAANNHTLFSAHYLSDNGKYEAFAHYLHQNVNNEEYGGISDLSLFTGGDSRFRNRQNITVNLNDSDSRYWYRRYYFSHTFAPFDPLRWPFKVSHTVFHQGNKYWFNLGSADVSAFEGVNMGRGLSSASYSDNLSNTVSLLFDEKRFKLDAGVRHQRIGMGASNTILNTEILAGAQYVENRLGAVGRLEVDFWDRLALNAFLEYSKGGRFGHYLHSANRFRLTFAEGYALDGHLHFQSALPGFQYLLNFSPVLGYNYDVSGEMKNQNILDVGGTVALKWLEAKLSANYFRVDHYAYFDASGQPRQSPSSVNVSQVGGEAAVGYRKFHLHAKVQLQSVLNHKSLYPMPQVLARVNGYWQGKAFKDAAEIMTGLKVYYFSRFDSRDFSPVLNEFILPNSRAYAIGGQPIVDAYFNLRVKTMQIYLEGQNLTAAVMQNRSYTAPYYPLYDFRLNIGIVWQLFH
ncbi:putative porin [Bergeyella sp. RCAD1439]|uniref:putative porin n=1 Tax=Bergeyella anatis TaxID=3113737 RepID=UPI002E1845E3|nr:putative porin [Bergeyella sp. RCAD1439]